VMSENGAFAEISAQRESARSDVSSGWAGGGKAELGVTRADARFELGRLAGLAGDKRVTGRNGVNVVWGRDGGAAIELNDPDGKAAASLYSDASGRAKLAIERALESK
jgi:hypothetical protein